MANFDWSSLRCRMLWAYQGAVPQNGNGAQAVCSEYFAWLLLRGSAAFRFNGETASMTEGEWGFPPPNAKGRFHRFSPDARIISIRFRLEWPDGRYPLKLKHFVSFGAHSQPQLSREARNLVKLAQGCLGLPMKDRAPFGLKRHMAIQASFLHWLQLWLEAMAENGIEAETPSETKDLRVVKMIEQMEGQRKGGPVRYDLLSEVSSLGRTQIDRLFREETGCTPKKLQERRLLERCKERIIETELNGKELSYEFGFSSAAQFCAWFKRHVGMSPARFKASDW